MEKLTMLITRSRTWMVCLLAIVILELAGCGRSTPAVTAPSAIALTPSVDMAGDYTVTFTSTCASLPPDLRQRTYQATIGSSPYHGYVTVPLAGGMFIEGWDSLPMDVESDYVAFWIEILVDQIAPKTYFIVNALAAAHVGTQVKETYTFPLDGSIDYCRTQDTGAFEDCYHNPVSRVSCASGQLTLTRR